MNRWIVVIAIILIVGGCRDKERTIKELQKHGYTDIKTRAHTLGDCDPAGTFFETDFLAINKEGVREHGIVCSDFRHPTTVWIYQNQSNIKEDQYEN